jgi:hypothetical protein
MEIRTDALPRRYNGRPISEVYRGRQLILTPAQKNDGTWECECVLYLRDRYG